MKCENKHEKEFWQQGYTCIIGIDEAGRGPIAGPLVVAGVCFPKGYEHDVIYDSKKLSEKKREALFDTIKEDALYYAIEIVDESIIDKYNIYATTQMCMEKIANDCKECDAVLSDAMPLPHIEKPVESIIKGDQKSVSIAAASILAKVTRDRIMYEYDKQYPEYGFKNHKGYGTKLHIEKVHELGILPIHRKSYQPIKGLLENKLDL